MERYYFYIDQSGAQHGPLSIKQLIAENISPSTLVWYEGLSDWQSADQIIEVREELNVAGGNAKFPPRTPAAADFAPLYDVRPPAYERERVIIKERPKKWVIESVLVTIFCCMPMGIVALIYALRAEDKWNGGLYDEALSASRSAGTWVKVSIFAVILYPIIYLLLIMMGMLPLMFM